jgi:hypothetical protein
MARIYVVVLVPASLPTEKIGHTVTTILRPHCLYFEFEPFRIACECVWGDEFGIAKANEEIGDFHELWRRYNLLSDNQRPDWKEYIRSWEEKAIESARFYRLYRKPDPKCNMCNGSGIVVRTSYPFFLYEYWVDENWVNLGLAGSVTLDTVYVEAIITPDEQLHKRVYYFHRYSPKQWKEKCQSILGEYSDYLAIKCFLYK